MATASSLITEYESSICIFKARRQLQGCLKVWFKGSLHDRYPSWCEHSFDVVGQFPQALADHALQSLEAPSHAGVVAELRGGGRRQASLLGCSDWGLPLAQAGEFEVLAFSENLRAGIDETLPGAMAALAALADESLGSRPDQPGQAKPRDGRDEKYPISLSSVGPHGGPVWDWLGWSEKGAAWKKYQNSVPAVGYPLLTDD